jgi:hypothetical protein
MSFGAQKREKSQIGFKIVAPTKSQSKNTVFRKDVFRRHENK